MTLIARPAPPRSSRRGNPLTLLEDGNPDAVLPLTGGGGLALAHWHGRCAYPVVAVVAQTGESTGRLTRRVPREDIGGIWRMHFLQLDLNLLVALDALLTERNITEAGRALHVTQPAMSGSLARLREYFGDELLVQVGRKMVPTPLAESLAEPVRSILLQIKAAVNARPEFDPATSSRRFSLMMSDYVSTVLMSEVVKRVEPIAPHIGFEIVSNDQPTPSEALERGDIDLLLMPRDHLAMGHPHQPLFTDGYTCVVWTGNESVGDSLSAEEYLRLGHVCVQLARGRSPVVDEWFLSRLGVKRRTEVITMSFSSVPQFVVGTQRIATIHQRLAKFYCRHMPLRIVPCPFEMPMLVESVQWHKYFDNDPGRAWLCGILKEVAGDVDDAGR